MYQDMSWASSLGSAIAKEVRLGASPAAAVVLVPFSRPLGCQRPDQWLVDEHAAHATGRRSAVMYACWVEAVCPFWAHVHDVQVGSWQAKGPVSLAGTSLEVPGEQASSSRWPRYRQRQPGGTISGRAVPLPPTLSSRLYILTVP